MSRGGRLGALGVPLLLAAGAARGGGIAGTMHNLSVNGPGPVRAAAETQICVFCHAPHDADPSGPLWNHRLSSGVTYTKYASSSLVAYAGQASAPDPNGASKLCLACHDGTVALGAVSSRGAPIPLQGGKGGMAPGDSGFVGTDLSRTHPISFTVTAAVVSRSGAQNQGDLALAPLAGMQRDPRVHLDAQGRVQCTACHEPHDDANFATSGVHFYATPARAGPCAVCHVSAAIPDPAASSGAPAGGAAPAPLADGASASLVGSPRDGAGPRAGGDGPALAHVDPATLPLGCLSCHAGHSPEAGKARLLLARDEEACYRCHGAGRQGEVDAGRLSAGARPVAMEAEFLKPSHHPVEWPGDHRPGERTPETNPSARRHVTCADCHDAHGTLRATGTSVPGGRRRSPTRRFPSEPELCFMCHGPAANRPAQQPDAQRQFQEASFHPVLGPGRGLRVPSLLPPLTTASVIGCGDCHGSDDPGGPAGPHGSVYAPLLVRGLARDDGQPESPGRYDLCYGCHSRANLLADRSFPFHRKHVVELRAPCAACHSSHGADAPHLVEFDPIIVQPNARGLLSYVAVGAGGQCALACHGANHDPASYCGQATPCTAAARGPLPAPSPAAAAAERLSPVPRAESLFPGWPGR